MRLSSRRFARPRAPGTCSPRPEQPKDEAVTIGPWQIEAAYKGQKFERCAMSRETPDGVNVRFTRDADGLELNMSSPKWKLGRGKSYPVELAAGKRRS